MSTDLGILIFTWHREEMPDGSWRVLASSGEDEPDIVVAGLTMTQAEDVVLGCQKAWGEAWVGAKIAMENALDAVPDDPPQRPATREASREH